MPKALQMPMISISVMGRLPATIFEMAVLVAGPWAGVGYHVVFTRLDATLIHRDECVARLETLTHVAGLPATKHGYIALMRLLHVQSPTQGPPRTSAVELCGQLVLALEGYYAIEAAACANSMVSVINE